MRLLECQGDMSNKEFAELLGVSRQTLGFWYNSDRTPDMDMLVKISTALDVSIDYLVGLSDSNSLDYNVQALSSETGLSDKAIHNLHEIFGDENISFVDEDNQLHKVENTRIRIINEFLEDKKLLSDTLELLEGAIQIKTAKESEFFNDRDNYFLFNSGEIRYSPYNIVSGMIYESSQMVYQFMQDIVLGGK